MTTKKTGNVAPVANLLRERMSEHVGVPNPARPDGRAIHYGENFVMTTNRASNLAPVANLLREKVSEHVGVPNPARLMASLSIMEKILHISPFLSHSSECVIQHVQAEVR